MEDSAFVPIEECVEQFVTCSLIILVNKYSFVSSYEPDMSHTTIGHVLIKFFW